MVLSITRHISSRGSLNNHNLCWFFAITHSSGYSKSILATCFHVSGVSGIENIQINKKCFYMFSLLCAHDFLQVGTPTANTAVIILVAMVLVQALFRSSIIWMKGITFYC